MVHPSGKMHVPSSTVAFESYFTARGDVQPETLATHGHEISAYEIGTASHPASASGKKFRAVLRVKSHVVIHSVTDRPSATSYHVDSSATKE